MRNVINKKKNTKRNVSGGFTLLIAVLTTTIVLAVGTAIFNITIKELELSSLSRESQYALQAADAGIECVLYWNLRDQELLGTYAFPQSATEDDVDPRVSCFGVDLAPIAVPTGLGAEAATTTFSITSPYCVTLVVAKSVVPFTDTYIISKGYNTCDTSSPKRVERTIRVIY